MTNDVNDRKKIMTEAVRLAVISRCVVLNYIEAAQYDKIPSKEILATMVKSISTQVRCSTRAMRQLFLKTVDWKKEEGKNEIVSVADLKYEYERHTATQFFELHEKTKRTDMNLPYEKEFLTLPPVKEYVAVQKMIAAPKAG